MRVKAGFPINLWSITLLFSMLLLCSCLENTEVFEGFLVYGEEWALYVPSLSDPDDEYWFNDRALADSVTTALYSSSVTVSADSAFWREEAVWIKFTGKVRIDGEYGHLGKYSKEVRVIEILDYSADPVLKYLDEKGPLIR